MPSNLAYGWARGVEDDGTDEPVSCHVRFY